MLRRLSVFAGGCTLHAAEAVSGATGDLPAEVLELVASLVDKNLLRQVEWTGGEPRLRRRRRCGWLGRCGGSGMCGAT